MGAIAGDEIKDGPDRGGRDAGSTVDYWLEKLRDKWRSGDEWYCNGVEDIAVAELGVFGRRSLVIFVYLNNPAGKEYAGAPNFTARRARTIN